MVRAILLSGLLVSIMGESTGGTPVDRFSKGREWDGRPLRDNTIMHPHSALAQPLWASVLEAGDVAVDATCGNGNDTLFLARAAAAAGGGSVLACDIQRGAIASAKGLLARALPELDQEDWTLPPSGEHGPTPPVPVALR
ncbi:hypothetical protein T484DRAFT_1844152 [Baffinella frigidus]|nr:hypothetical protein T484DRAFT_1844152 [Cryptophyta sp. CCMP2293]